MDQVRAVQGAVARGIVRSFCTYREYSSHRHWCGTVMRYFLLPGAKATLAQGIIQAPATGGPIAGTGPLH
jgi:hypothetical protein